MSALQTYARMRLGIEASELEAPNEEALMKIYKDQQIMELYSSALSQRTVELRDMVQKECESISKAGISKAIYKFLSSDESLKQLIKEKKDDSQKDALDLLRRQVQTDIHRLQSKKKAPTQKPVVQQARKIENEDDERRQNFLRSLQQNQKLQKNNIDTLRAAEAARMAAVMAKSTVDRTAKENEEIAEFLAKAKKKQEAVQLARKQLQESEITKAVELSQSLSDTDTLSESKLPKHTVEYLQKQAQKIELMLEKQKQKAESTENEKLLAEMVKRQKDVEKRLAALQKEKDDEMQIKLKQFELKCKQCRANQQEIQERNLKKQQETMKKLMEEEALIPPEVQAFRILAEKKKLMDDHHSKQEADLQAITNARMKKMVQQEREEKIHTKRLQLIQDIKLLKEEQLKHKKKSEEYKALVEQTTKKMKQLDELK